MWTRKELKDKAKVSFKANYWKAVLMALMLALLVGGVSSVGPSASVPAAPSQSASSPDNVNVEVVDGKVVVDVEDEDGQTVHVNMDVDDVEDLAEKAEVHVDADTVRDFGPWFGPGVVLVGLAVLLASLIVVALAIVVYVFVFSPLEVGGARFFLRNLNQRAEVREVAFGYDNNYKEIVKTLFLRTLFIILWSLLLIVPGIYKAYEYRMIPYLLADDPSMTKDRAFEESRRMMDGQKWNAFVLDLSFLGWNILSLLTLGVLGIFYVNPYQEQTNAALYERLRYGLPAPEQFAQPTPNGPASQSAQPGQPVAVSPAYAPSSATETAPVIVSASQPPVTPFAAPKASDARASDDEARLGGSAADGSGPDSPEA